MYKRLFYPGVDDQGNVLVEALFTRGLTKTARANPAHKKLHPELRAYIDKLAPSPDKMYVLVNALGAWEYYGQNINGDAFRAAVLRNEDKNNGYLTFYKADVFRHHCFPAGTEVLLPDHTRVPIEEIQIGDAVMTLEGIKVVTETMRNPYKGPGRSLSLKGRMDPLVATEEHPVLVYRRDQVHCRHKYSKLSGKCSCRENKESIGEPEWLPIKDVLPGDYLVYPRPKGGDRDIPEAFAEFVGWVASEGCLGRKGLIQFTFGEGSVEDIERVSSCAEALDLRVTVTPRPDHGTMMLSMCSKKIHDALSMHIQGTGPDKRLTSEVLHWSEESLLRMLGAYIDGDGHVYKTGRNRGQLRIRSASRSMLHILGDVIRKLGLPCALNWDSPPREFVSPVDGYGPYMSNGSGCVSVQAAHSPSVARYSRKVVTRKCRDPQQELLDDVFLVRVTDVDEIDLDEDVFNLEVEGPHHYIANEIVAHNCNKDPEKGFGKVVVSVWNPRMYRVELLLQISRVKARELGHGDLIDALDRGEHPAVSMGMRTPYDVCLMCGHKSRTRRDYCKHARPGAMGTIHPDGRQNGVDNPVFKAFDISFVLIGADQTSFAIEKVAYANLMGPLAQLAAAENARQLEKEGGHKTAADKLATLKFAEIRKRIPTMDKMQNTEDDIPADTLNAMAKKPLGNALSSAAAGGIVLKPHEFQRIVLVRMGRPDYADMLDRSNSVFAPCSCGKEDRTPMRPDMVLGSILRLLMPLIGGRSCFAPALSRRSAHIPGSPKEKRAHVRGDLLDKIAVAYDGYRSEMIDQLPGIAKFVTCQDPEILGRIYPDELEEVFTGTSGLAKTARFGPPQTALLMGSVLPAAYLLTRSLKKAVGLGESEDGALKGFVKDHPLISASIAIGIARHLAK